LFKNLVIFFLWFSPLEAFKLGTPLVYSDLDGLKDQVKKAALLINV